MVWGGISVGGRTDLHIIRNGTLTGRRYAHEILRPHVIPYAGAIGDFFVFQDDNARPHRARLMENMLEAETIQPSKRRIQNSEPLSTPSAPHKRKSEVFDFKKLCLLCSQVADEAAETKREREREKYRRTRLAKRISEITCTCTYDLMTSEAKYLTLCYANFLNRLPFIEKKSHLDNQVSEDMAEIFNYIEIHDDSQFTLKELRYVLTEAAAAIIREDIRSSVIETKSYPPPSQMLNDVNQDKPKSLLYFLQEVIMKNRKGKIANSKTKYKSMSHAKMVALRKQSFSSQLLLSLSVFLHRRYGYKRPIDVLHSLGFAASYGNTAQHEISAVYHSQSRILSSELGSLVQYVGEHADINVYTLNGNNTLHVMGTKIVIPKDVVLYNDHVQKYTTKPSAKELAAI
ncbi:uncharacterized protein TNCV_1415421 [Trichonephila clavipes]|nr:uncharacterized protein TNCV_1415421 [Trichonephila clavipes]